MLDQLLLNGEIMAICIQKYNIQGNNIQGKTDLKKLEELEKKVEFAQKFLDVLKERNKIYFEPSLRNDDKKRSKVIREFNRIMEERLQLEF